MLKHLYILFIIMQALAAISRQSKGPVAKYSFNDGSVKDEAGNNDAKAYGLSLTEDRFGNANFAYFFRGNFDAYLNLGTSNVLKPKQGSISLWVYIEQPVYKGKGIPINPVICTRAFAGDDFNEGYLINYDFDVKKICANTSLSEYSQIYLAPAKITTLLQWHHVVLTYDNNFGCFYIDGVLESKAAKDFESRFLEGDSVMVGYRIGEKNKRYLQGKIDDIEIYDRVLSRAEVLDLYNAPNPNKTAIIVKWILLGVLVILLILLIMWWVKRRVNRAVNAEKEKSRLNNRLIELETRAIRAQMNPHFIFNSLNTLLRFVLEDNKEKSYTYLIEFSRLLRKLLETSESDTISLKEEIEILTAYLEIEKLRFDNSFEYSISSDLDLMEFVYIPIMLVQPFAENAVWHGLLNKKGMRLLKIRFKNIDDKKILCEIDDNGVGRSKEKEPGEIKKKSLALDFIKQRLDLIKQSTGIECSFEIIDKVDVQGNSLGTMVKIIIPKLN